MDSKTKKILIGKYLKPDVLRKRGAWPREMKIFNDLSAAYQDVDFWNWYKPTFELNSLAWFLGDGKTILFQAHEAFVFDKIYKSSIVKEDVFVKADPAIQPAYIPPKPKTLSSWLRKQPK